MLKLWGSMKPIIKPTLANYHAIHSYNSLLIRLQKLVTLVQNVGNWEKKLVTSQFLVILQRPIISYYIDVMGI